MTVESQTIKGEYTSFLVKFIITKEFYENQRVLFDPYIHKVCVTRQISKNFAYTLKIRLLKWL